MIERLAHPKATPHLGVDLAAGHADIKGGARGGWQIPHPRRVIAFVGSCDERVTCAEGTRRCQCRWQEGKLRALAVLSFACSVARGGVTVGKGPIRSVVCSIIAVAGSTPAE